MSPLLELGAIALGLYLAGWLAQKLGLSSIIGYMLLGLLLGPYGFYTLYEATAITGMLGELGILMLLFYMGLEFSPQRFLEGGRATTRAGLLDLLNFPAGFLIGMLLGFGWLASLFLGGIVYISSSGVITKLLIERNLIAYPEAERSLGVLVFEDLAMVFVLGGLGLITSGGGLLDFAGVALFFVLYLLLMRYGRAQLERLLSREGEALVLLALALVILFSVGAKSLGFPEAVAAFLLGMMVAESHFKERIIETLTPWRDVAAAVFFLDFGLHVDVLGALGQIPAALLLIAVTIVVNLATGFWAGRLTGLSPRSSVGHGLMLIPRGEFSLVIVGLATTVSSIPQNIRDNLAGMTSLYVIALVILGSVIFRYYDAITQVLSAPFISREAQEAERQRQQELEAMTLD